jgi:hypothetical protein
MVMVIDLPDLDAGAWQPPSGSQLVVTYDPLTAAQRARAHELEANIRESLGPNAPLGRLRIGLAEFITMERLGVSAAVLDEFHALEQRGDAYAVYVTPPPPA